MKARRQTVATTWEVWTYDVWGNARDGYEVNDRSCLAREYPLRLTVETFNEGKAGEFQGASPSDRQLREAFGLERIKIDTDGDDLTIYVRRARDGYPIGELTCTSHTSLSPIRSLEA